MIIKQRSILYLVFSTSHIMCTAIIQPQHMQNWLGGVSRGHKNYLLRPKAVIAQQV